MKYWKNNQDGILVWGTGSTVTGEEITAEEYAQLMAGFEARQKAIADYVEKVKAGEMTLEEVPQEYYAEVEAIINAPEPEPYDPKQALIDEILAEVNV